MNFQDQIAVSHIKNASSNLNGPTKFSKENYNVVSHKQSVSCENRQQKLEFGLALFSDHIILFCTLFPRIHMKSNRPTINMKE
jgi:hypothetical protein